MRMLADCRLPIADCRLPIADCRLPIADCDSTATAFAVKLFWLVCVMCFSLCYANGFCHRQRSLYIKNPNVKFFVKKFVIPTPAYAGAGCGGNQLAAGRRMLRRRKPPVTWTGILYPRHSRVGGNPPFCHFSICAKAQTAIYRRKWQTPAAAKPPEISAAKGGATHSRIFPHCYAMRFALRANSKNAAIIAYAIMTAPKARLDSRLRGNDKNRHSRPIGRESNIPANLPPR